MWQIDGVKHVCLYPGRSCKRNSSNNELKEVSRGRSSEEVSVMETE